MQPSPTAAYTISVSSGNDINWTDTSPTENRSHKSVNLTELSENEMAISGYIANLPTINIKFSPVTALAMHKQCQFVIFTASSPPVPGSGWVASGEVATGLPTEMFFT